MTLPPHAPAEAFFLDTAHGARFCLFHAPQGRCRGALVYLHPFAEEMNKSRRMAALQARLFAAHGYGVLQLDLQGCGDSEGGFADARWAHWRQDTGAASAWLLARLGQPVGLWGLRLGALLALDYARQAMQPVAHLLLWQPVTSGAAFLTQFLRLKIAGAMLDGGAAAGSTEALRASLGTGEALEVAGYLLAPQLAGALDALDAAAMAPRCPTSWLEVVGAAGRPLPPGAGRIVAAWERDGARVAAQAVHCAPFWTTQEVTECPALLEASLAALEEGLHD